MSRRDGSRAGAHDAGRSTGWTRPSLRQVVASHGKPPPSLSPILTLELDLASEIPSIDPNLPTITGRVKDGGAGYSSCRILVRLHHRPIGILVLDLVDGSASPTVLEEAIWKEFGPVLVTHLQHDKQIIGGVADRPSFPVDGPCLYERSSSWTPLVSVIVCTIGRPRQLETAVDALLRMSYPNFELIVVDNDPRDVTTKALIHEKYRDAFNLQYVAEPRRGLSAARNRGIAAAKGEIIAFTDDDIIVDSFWLSALAGGFDEDGEVGCVTGVTLASELESPAQIMFERYGVFNRGYEPRLFRRDMNPAKTSLYPYTAGVFGAGGNSAVRPACFKRELAFDCRLGPGTPAFGAEDLDIFLRLILDGKSIRYEPSAIAWHEHRRSYDDLRWQMFTYGAGFTAMLTKWYFSNLRAALDLTLAAPRVLVSLVGVKVRSDKSKGESLPAELVRLERLGFIYGPIGFLRSALSNRRIQGSSKRLRSTQAPHRESKSSRARVTPRQES